MEGVKTLDLTGISLGIGIPSNGLWHSKFGHDYGMMCGWLQKECPVGTRILTAEGSMLCALREGIVNNAIESGCTHLLWLDTDMYFPPDTPGVLLKDFLLIGENAAVVGANCVMRKPPHNPTSHYLDGTLCYTTDRSVGLSRVLQIGFGVTMMSVRWLEKLEIPRMSFPWSKSRQTYYGEDVRACHEINRIGGEIYVDHDLSKFVRHEGTYAFSHDDLPQWNSIPAEESRTDVGRQELEIPQAAE